MSRILESLSDRLVLASSILGGALVVAAIILTYGMASLGERIETAGRAAGNTPSEIDVRVSSASPVEIREAK